ncbi:MAG TPA: SCO family protein [Chitinophagaceae bacterium]|nr:SCO family protein [Chitinophagaceae bacterium]
MSSKALLALCIAILFPLVSYLMVKYYSDDAVVMPPRYYEDSIITKTVNGKETTDTAWHSVRNITLTNQLGGSVSLDSLHGKIIVADFFFTRCPSICPHLTHNMKRMQDGLKPKDDLKRVDTSFVQFLSFSVDPERDSAEALKKYADRFGVNPDVWWLLTGPKKKIYDFALNELKLGLQDGGSADSNFIHSQKMVLLDKERVVRGYYDGLDTTEMIRMSKDIVLLMLEKDKHKKSEVVEELKNIWPIFVIVLLAVVIFMLVTRKPK